MTRSTRSIRPLLLAVLALLIGLPAAAQSPGASVRPIDPATAPGIWAQVVHGAEGRTQVIVGRSGLPGVVAVDEPVPVNVVGPQDGWLLAWWRTGSRTDVVQIDPSGRVRSLLRTADTISAVALEPRGDRWLWAVAHRDGSLAAIYRAKTASQRLGSRTLVAGSNRLPATRLLWLGSRDRLGVELQGANGFRLRIHDLRTGDVRPSAFEGTQRVIGALGDELLAGTLTPSGAIAAPLVAIDPATGAARSVTTAVGTGAFQNESGSFTWDETGADGSSTVWSLAAGAPARALATVPADGRTLASTSGVARAEDPEVAAFVPGGSWLAGSDPDASIVTVELRSGRSTTIPAYEVLHPIGLAWTPMRVSGASKRAWLRDVVGWKQGPAVLGARDQDGTPGIWLPGSETSQAAVERPRLEPGAVPVEANVLRRLAAGSDRLLAAGVTDGTDPHVAIWTTTDGDRWQRIPDQQAFHVPGSDGTSLGLRTVGNLAGRPALVLTQCIESCDRPWVLTQTGPGRWSRTRVPVGVYDVVDGDGRLLAEQEAPDRTVHLLATTDGRRWEDTGIVLPPPGEHRLVDAAGGPLIVSASPVSEPLTILRTDDGRTWETTFTDAHPWDVQAVAAEGDRVVIVGDVVLDWDRDVQVDATLISTDGGRTWERYLLGRAPVGSRVESVAIIGDQAIAVGGPHAWIIDLPE